MSHVLITKIDRENEKQDEKKRAAKYSKVTLLKIKNKKNKKINLNRHWKKE